MRRPESPRNSEKKKKKKKRKKKKKKHISTTDRRTADAPDLIIEKRDLVSEIMTLEDGEGLHSLLNLLGPAVEDPEEGVYVCA